MAYTTIDNPELYFQCKIYTGNGSTNAITLDGDENMQPDMVWVKDRGRSGYNHILNDSVRGVTKYIRPNLEGDEDTYSDAITAFNSDGFTLGADSSNGEHNVSSQSYVAWCWKANGSGSSDTNGSVNSIATSANTTSGFSITHFNLSGESGEETVGHGLGVAPDFIFAKTGLDKSGNSIWWVYHKGLTSASYYLSLAGTGAESSDTQAWGGDAPTSSVFTVGDASGWGTYKTVAYCFSGKQGFSKFGKYTGNGSTDGTFVYTGFRPAWFMYKRTDSTNNWHVIDNKRSPINETDKVLYADTNDAEDTSTNANQVDFCATGVKIREDNDGQNGSGATYVYMAFAEAPFVNSKGVPANAR